MNRRSRKAEAEDEKRKHGKQITKYLYDTFRRTRREISSLYDKVEAEYMSNGNLELKAKSLEIYCHSLSEIKFLLDVERREVGNDNKEVIRLNLMKMLNEDQYYGVDYRGEVEVFSKNCNSILYNMILGLYNRLRDWLGRTKIAMTDLVNASVALQALSNYNRANEALRKIVEDPDQQLPPVHRVFRGQTDPIDVSSRVLSLDEIGSEQYNLIMSAYSVLKIDLVGFNPFQEQAIPRGMDGFRPDPEIMEYIDYDRELESYVGFDGTLLEFMRMRYPDWSEETLIQVYFDILFYGSDHPVLFNKAFDSGFKGEIYDGVYEVVSINNRKDEQV